MNNTKQISKTEGNIQATDIAEMGITYYKAIIQSSIAEVNGLGATSTINYYNNLNTKLNEKIDITNLKKPISGNNVYFELQEFSNLNKYNLTTPTKLPNNITTYLDTTSNKIGVLLGSKGTVKGKTRTLGLYLLFDIRLDLGGKFTITMPTDAELTSNCGTTLSTESYTDSKCVYEGNQSIGTLDSVKDTTLYIDGDMAVTDKINSIEGGKIHIDGDLTISGELNNFNRESIIEVERDATINTINNTDKSIKLIVGRDLFVKFINNIKDSFIEVFGNATLGNFPTPGNGDISNIDNTTIVIHGDAKLPNEIGTFKDTSKICVFGNLITGSNNNQVYVKGETGFEAACGNPYGGQSKYILKSDPEITVDYN
jgi:hypothetical protein